MMKMLIPNQYYGKVLDYSKASGKAAIIKALEHLTSDKVKNMWTKIIKTSKDCILNAKTAAEQTNLDENGSKSNGTSESEGGYEEIKEDHMSEK